MKEFLYTAWYKIEPFLLWILGSIFLLFGIIDLIISKNPKILGITPIVSSTLLIPYTFIILSNKFVFLKKEGIRLIIALIGLIFLGSVLDSNLNKKSNQKNRNQELLKEQVVLEEISNDDKISNDNEKNPNLTLSQINAEEMSRNYLNTTAFSYKGLINQLVYEGFSESDARYGADNCGADWKFQASQKAKDYLINQPFSRKGLINQLIYEGFTEKEAVYGVNNTGL
jgi:hypothetical protein